jgi:KaiC/GvpD/RAD55 family RecA-like ATPase
VEAKRLVIVKLEPTDAKTTIMRVKSELPEFIKSFGATRIVFDSVSLLNMLFDSEHDKRVNLFNLSQLVKRTGATCLMTAEVNDENPLATRDGLVEYVADGVIALRYLEIKEKNEMILTLRVVKMRRIKHSRRITPYSIGQKGLEVHAGAEL